MDRSHAAALLAAGRIAEARGLLESRLADQPNRGWILRELAELAGGEIDRHLREAKQPRKHQG